MSAQQQLGRVAQRVSDKISKSLSPVVFEIINESNKHGGYFDGKESHFKLVVVSSDFQGLPLIKRHRLVNSLLAEELAEDIHALSLVTKTPEQWEANSSVPKSPNCLGGSQTKATSEPQDQKQDQSGGQQPTKRETETETVDK